MTVGQGGFVWVSGFLVPSSGMATRAWGGKIQSGFQLYAFLACENVTGTNSYLYAFPHRVRKTMFLARGPYGRILDSGQGLVGNVKGSIHLAAKFRVSILHILRRLEAISQTDAKPNTPQGAGLPVQFGNIANCVALRFLF